jgi:superfamily II DNA/RNA helicase
MKDLEDEDRESLVAIVVRFMRTASFLVRYVDISERTSADDLIAALDRPDQSGATLAARIESLVALLRRQVPEERNELFRALTHIQTGEITSTAEHFDASERAFRREALLPNVRLANGGVKQETRRRLMLAFNTPFFPEVLVASSVMAEGVDLHLDCRHVIHHDLDWNPSVVEQRTGRLDRIGSKAESVGKPVVIYEPYLAGTHDEKMYRVMKDREAWFGIVMGNESISAESATERAASQPSLPVALAGELSVDLSVLGRATSD